MDHEVKYLVSNTLQSLMLEKKAVQEKNKGCMYGWLSRHGGGVLCEVYHRRD